MSKKVLLFATMVGLIVSNLSYAQDDPVVLKINDSEVRLSEFNAIYHKNNANNNVEDPKSVEEYLELFINFKLKVTEAKELGMDTLANYKKELNGYRTQLAQPYLTDNEVTDKLMREAYERSKMEVNASHIMIRISPESSPADTLKAYNKIMAIRDRVTKGEDFGQIAKSESEDPSAKTNNGDLGYFTALYMVYPFETAAYETEIGKVSQPVRTRFGYHILKVTDKRPYQGEITTAHIFVKLAKSDTGAAEVTARKKIDELYQRLQNGESFETVAEQFSEDRNSAKKGGELPPFKAGRMVKEYEDVAFALKNIGDVSKPVKTQYGFHIVKLLKREALQSYEDMEPELKTKIARDSRSLKSKDSFIANLKKEYGFKENSKTLDPFYPLIDSTYFQGTWSADKASKLKKTMFELSGKEYTQQDFAFYLQDKQYKREAVDAKMVINNTYDIFVKDMCIQYEDTRLESKYQDFRLLLQEYRDGILLFDLTDEKVWSKAVRDTTGLDNYFNANRSKYTWNERLDILVTYSSNAEIAKKSRELMEQGKSKDEILAEINTDSQLNVRVEEGKYEKEDLEVLSKIEWKKGLASDVTLNGQVVTVLVKEVVPAGNKELDEVKGLVTSDYQSYLEELWIKELREKYTITVNKDVLSMVEQ